MNAGLIINSQEKQILLLDVQVGTITVIFSGGYATTFPTKNLLAILPYDGTCFMWSDMMNNQTAVEIQLYKTLLLLLLQHNKDKGPFIIEEDESHLTSIFNGFDAESRHYLKEKYDIRWNI